MLTANKTARSGADSQPMVVGLVRKDVAQEVRKIVRKTSASADIRVLEGSLEAALLDFQSGPSAVVLQMSAGEAGEIDVVEDFLTRNPHLSVVILCDEVPFDQVRRLMRAGAMDILPQPLKEDDFLVALEAALVRVASADAGAQAAKTGRVLAFMKACGGVGGTTIAIQAAHTLAGKGRRRRKVCLIDFDLQFGNVAMYLDVEGARDLSDLLRPPDEIDATLFNAVAESHASGIDIVCAPLTVWSLDSIGIEQARKIIEVAARIYDYVIIDLPDYWTDWAQEVLRSADAIVLVMQMTVAAVRHARRRLDLLQSEGLGAIPVFVVANRYKKPGLFSSDTIKQEEVERALAHRIDFVLPSNFKVVNEAQTHGIPIAEAEGARKFASELGKIAETITARL